MREFPNATPRPWQRSGVVSQSVTLHRVFSVGPDSCPMVFLAGGPTDKEYVAARADADLIVHAVNTYEERERLLEEAAEVLRECLDYFEARADVNWEGDGPNAEMRMSMEVQAVVAKLEARDA